MLFVVRHAMPRASPDVPPHQWPLNADGRAAARRLRSRLPRQARLVSSEERKAWETLGGQTKAVLRDPRFNEVARPEVWSGEVEAVRRAYVDGTAHAGWERHGDAAARFEAGVLDHLAAGGDEDVVVATHGTVMTVWLLSWGGIAAGQAGVFWAGLRFPDCLVVDRGQRCWHRLL